MGLLIGLAILLIFGRFIGKAVFWVLGTLVVVAGFVFFAHIATWLVLIFLAIGGLSFLGRSF
ncbi:hypothetical protein [Furfurilactobacillus rossiae]|uniref:Uncharacterized protein n=1 Tax=Furfurilactobacillus rossiae DSM 15814 TaxID=1114972 RepID=A0A0R1RJR7_9LACO|nr:hypothetical protein [Furfurilactobacillus rossiae]KRL56951.1 hypothetical protein FD35_GL001248 [Furfurilactobacillus rossiae DSM 15814]QFR67018.1 hypothetical protein LR814_07895 [Furfurilactobacillus rossiae]QLE62523.1 hypothetical protein LROSRS0_2479 [Furfurilactobacillus rossiae]